MKNTIWLISVLFLMLLGSLVLKAEEPKSDDVDGSFEAIGYNNPVEIRSFQVFDKDGLLSASVFTPQERYVIQFEIYDQDTIEDLKKIEIALYYTVSGEAERSFSALLDEGTSLNGEELILVWERDISSADSNHPSSYQPTHPEDFTIHFQEGMDASLSTWAVLNSTTSSILPAGQTTPTAFTFEVEIRISKVAPESTEGEWQFGIQLTDGAFPNFSELYTLSKAAINVGTENVLTNPPSLFNMNFYGELRVPSGAAIIWQGVEPGMTYDHPNSLAVLENVIYIANGEYVHENSLNAFWVISGSAADGATLAALTADAFDGPQQFAVRAGMNVIGLSEPEEGIQMEPGGGGDVLAYAPIVLRERSDEIGHTYDFYYWLALSEVFQNAQYTGLVTAKVNNSVAVSGVSVVAFTGNVVNSLLASQNSGSPSNSPSQSPSVSGGVNTLEDNPPPVGKTGIYNWKDLWNIRENRYIDGQNFGPTTDYILMNHLNADTPGYYDYGNQFQVISWSNTSTFSGSLDGNGYTIEHLNIINPNLTGVQSLSLFSTLDDGAVLENLVISGVSISGNFDNSGSTTTRYEVAVLATVLNEATLSNITLSNINIDVSSPVEITYVAGVIGWLNVFEPANIENVFLENASITCDGQCPNVGGLFGRVKSDIDLSLMTLSQLSIKDVTVLATGDPSNQFGLLYGAIRDSSANIVTNQALEEFINDNTTSSGTNSP